jgi:hypothetical protein
MQVRQSDDGPQREVNAVTMPLAAVWFGVALSLAGVVPAMAQIVDDRSGVGDAVHWCLFNRPCNWSGHASIATGIVWGLRRADVKAEFAAVAAALVFLGKEVRDDMKWGNVLGTADSMGDLVSGFAGAYLGYRLVRGDGSGGASPVSLGMTADEGATLEVRIRTGPGRPRQPLTHSGARPKNRATSRGPTAIARPGR